MERIKQAIEKAKLARGEERPEAREEIIPLPGAESESPVTRDERGIKVRYRQTKVISLDEAHLARHRIFAHNKISPLTAAIDLLRTQVLHKMDENGWRTLAITSPTPEAGKTVVSINLAMSIARHTQRTAMLVDFDLRRPRVAGYLGLDASSLSWISALKGRVTLSEAMVNPGVRHFVVLPAGKPVGNPAEALASNKVSQMIGELRDRYDSRLVLFDLAPLLNVDDAITVLPKIDCVLLVVGNGMSTRREIEESLRFLQPFNLLGVVLNKADEDGLPGYY
jgi:hypothetical protein